MKKTIFALLLGVLSLLANDEDWPFACKESDIEFVKNDCYFKFRFFIAKNNDYVDPYPATRADAKTIQIDRKNKTVKVWTVLVASEQEKLRIIKIIGENNDFSNYGYTKSLFIVNYESMKSKVLNDIFYNCDGSIIVSNHPQGDWEDIAPSTNVESLVETIIKRYKLK